MNNWFAIHSPNDGPLLQRLYDDLVSAGLLSDTEWNERNNPLADIELSPCHTSEKYKHRKVFWFTLLISFKICMAFQNHDTSAQNHRDLTPDNYDAILSEILSHAD